MLRSRRERLDTYTRSAPPTSRQDRQVRVTTCKDHVICTARGHVTSEPCEPPGAMARRAHVASHASHPVRELAELALRAVRAIRCEGSQSSQTILYISSEDSPMESSSSTHVVIRTTRSVLQYKPHLVRSTVPSSPPPLSLDTPTRSLTLLSARTNPLSRPMLPIRRT